MSLYLKHIGDLPDLASPNSADLYEVETPGGAPASRKETRQAMQAAAASAGPVKDLVDAARAVAESKALSVSVNQGTPHFPGPDRNVDLTLTGQNIPYQSGNPANIKDTVDALKGYAEGLGAALPDTVKKPSVPRGTAGSTVDRRTLMQSLGLKSRNPSTMTLEALSADIEDDDGAVLIETLLTLPGADTTAAGLMSAASYNQIETNSADIAALKGANKRIPSQEALGETLTQEEVTAIWNAAAGNKVLTEGDTLISFHPATMNNAWTWFNSDQLWHFRGIDAISLANETALGAVKGSLEAGQVFVEADGTMSLNGYDDLVDGIAEAEAALEGRVLKVSGPVAGNIAVLDEAGGIADCGIPPDAKADKVSGAVPGNFAVFDENGNIEDSGKNADDVGMVETVDSVGPESGKNVALHRGVSLAELQNLYEHPDQAQEGAIYTISDNQTEADLLQAAKNYVDETLALGDRDHYDPDMPISSPNWDGADTYQAGDGVNHHYRGFEAKRENAGSEPCEGSPDWDLEADSYVVDGSMVDGVVMSGNYAAYGAGTGASGGRGFIVVDGYGLYCTEDTVLTQANIDAIIAFVDALAFPVPSWPLPAIPGAPAWRVMYGWTGNGRFQVSFYPGGVMRWVDPRVQLGLKETLDPQGGDPVTARGIAEWVREYVYPVGIIAAFANDTNPNVSFAPQTWERLPHQTFLRNVTGTTGGTGGSNVVNKVISHVHTLGQH